MSGLLSIGAVRCWLRFTIWVGVPVAVAVTGAVAGASDVFHQRNLGASYQLIAGYTPVSLVTDENAIDLDQQLIEKLLLQDTTESIAQAREVYKRGAFSGSYAALNISEGLPHAVDPGTLVAGSKTVRTVKLGIDGDTLDNAAQGSTLLKVQYRTSPIQSNYVNCQVGANPEPNLNGCFDEKGEIEVNGGILKYEYDPSADNENDRTIQRFNQDDYKFRSNGVGNYYHVFNNFYNYYGTALFADEWITSAFEARKTAFLHGFANFGEYNSTERAVAIKMGTAYLSIGIYVIRELEFALDLCAKQCVNGVDKNGVACTDNGVESLDAAVAYYTGSLEGTIGIGNGLLLFALAEQQCKTYRTCGMKGDSTSGRSKVNIEVFAEFDGMKTNLQKNDCNAAKGNKDRISSRILIPMIQGMLAYAHLLDYNPNSSTNRDEVAGSTFAAIVAPAVYGCDQTHGIQVGGYMNMGAVPDYNHVRKNVEATYNCLGITCADVGGMWDPATMNYRGGAGPCNFDGSNDKVREKPGLLSFLVIGSLVVVCILYLCFRRRGRKTEVIEYSLGSTGNGTSA